MTFKGLSRKQVIISMSTNSLERVMISSNSHMMYINRALQDIKLDIYADYICSDNRGIVIVTNKVASASDMNMIKKYMKNMNNINSKDVSSPCLPQSKLYLKVLGISYFVGDTNPLVSVDVIEVIIQNTHIFNDTVLTSHHQIIKALSKLDMAII